MVYLGEMDEKRVLGWQVAASFRQESKQSSLLKPMNNLKSLHEKGH